MESNQYKISELSQKASVTKRTVHYYISRGLIPPPIGFGVTTQYNDEHYFRILLIKKLQNEFMPLDEIKKRINLMKLTDVKLALDTNVIPENTINGKKQIGILYEKLILGLGIEIHYPSNNDTVKSLVEKIYSYSQSIMKEG